MATCFILLGFAQLISGASPSKTPKRKFRINYNSPYYASPFEPCKKFRDFNAVELVRAQAFAVNLFGRCGRQIVTNFIIRHNIPGFGMFPTLIHLLHGSE